MVGQNSTSSQYGISNLFFDVRSLFYLILPGETYYEKAQDVPDITKNSVNVFFAFVLIEQIIFLIKHGRFAGRINDMVASMTSGLLCAIPNIFTRKLHYVIYAWVFENYRIYELAFDSVFTYLFTFLFVDMMYYWFHRASHEINFFWASHQTHHSSEDYNFTTALRQSVFQGLYFWFWYLPLALFVRPSIYMVHGHLNIVFMFWIHTEIVDSIGPLEYIFNTPSHHRVHHGRNPYCLDKNYGGVLIIWDRLFGTFEAENRNEEIAYGLVHPLKTFDPIHLQIFNYKYIIKKCLNTTNWSHRFGYILNGPAWNPGTPRLGNPETVPKIKYPVVKYDGKVLDFMNVYVAVQFAFVAILFTEMAREVEQLPTLGFSLAVIYAVYNLTCFGWIFDAKPNCLIYEGIRILSLILCCIFYTDIVKKYLFKAAIIYEVFWWLNLASFVFIVLLWSCNISFKKQVAKKVQ